MKQFVFSIKDTKVGEFHSPFCVRHEKEARRLLEGLVKDPQSTIHNYPEDFALFWVGEFETNEGKFVPGKAYPQFVCNAVEYQEKPSTQQQDLIEMIREQMRIVEEENAENS